MENKAARSGAQFGSLVVPGAHASADIFSFTGVTLHFAGSVTRIVDADPGAFTITGAFSVGDPVTGSLTCDESVRDTAPEPVYVAASNAPDVILAIGSSFSDSLPGFQIVLNNDAAGTSIDLEFDFSSVTSPIFTRNVDVAMVITLADSTSTVIVDDVLPSKIALRNFDHTQLLVVFFDPLSANFSFIEVGLEQFSARGIAKSKIRESLIDTPRQGCTLVPQEELASRRRAAQQRDMLEA
jgi:hypothetical protein